MNKALDSYHPKISYLIEKYKEYLVSIYNNIKISLVNKIETKIEKFSIINYIINFITMMNKNYNDGLNLVNILQCGEESSEIINKVGQYLIDFYFDVDSDSDSDENGCEDDSQEDMKDLNFDENEENIDLNLDENKESEMINFDEFYPIKKVNRTKQKKKLNYVENFGEENELKKFLNNLDFIRNSKKKLKLI